jgi:hypothetical protein
MYKHERIGLIIFGPSALANKNRNKIFGTIQSGKIVNKYFLNIARVVLDPRFRGAGLAGDFIKLTSYLVPTRYIEIITSLSAVNGFLKKAGFRYVGRTNGDMKGAWSLPKTNITASTVRSIVQSKMSITYYWILDKGGQNGNENKTES